MEHFVTKEQVKQVLEHHGHHIVMDSAFITGAPMSEIEAIVDVCDVVAKAAYDQGVKDSMTSTEEYVGRVAELEKQAEQLSQANKDLARAALKPETDEAEELEKAIETIQAAISCSFSDNLKLEVTWEHVYLHYEDLKFLVATTEAWRAIRSCVFLSGLEGLK